MAIRWPDGELNVGWQVASLTIISAGSQKGNGTGGSIFECSGFQPIRPHLFPPVPVNRSIPVGDVPPHSGKGSSLCPASLAPPWGFWCAGIVVSSLSFAIRCHSVRNSCAGAKGIIYAAESRSQLTQLFGHARQVQFRPGMIENCPHFATKPQPILILSLQT